MPTREFFLAVALLFLGGGSDGDAGTLAVGARAPWPPAFLKYALAEAPPVGSAPGNGGGGSVRNPAGPSWNLLRKKREEEAPSYLKWVTFEGQLPADAVANWNGYAKRLEYVCAAETFGCHTGAYVPARGPFCFFPLGGRERAAADFKVLVNAGGFEALDWADESFGGVPADAVEGCPSVDVFVGRNRYGLGKVLRGQRALFVAVDGEEVWYKWYQVLAVKKGPANVTISHVRYNLSGAAEGGEDVTLRQTTVENEGCRGARKRVALEEATEVEHDWTVDQRVFATLRGVLETGLLVFREPGWAVTNVTSIPWVGGASTGRYVDHTHVAEEEVGARTACTVALEGRRLDVRVPFVAQLTRGFGDGQLHRVTVTGWARSRAVVGVRATFKECWPLTHLPPCRP